MKAQSRVHFNNIFLWLEFDQIQNYEAHYESDASPELLTTTVNIN